MIIKRLIGTYASDLQDLTREALKASILASEGRVVAAEDVVTTEPLIAGVTNAEMMTAFGADLILLNEFDVFTKKIKDFPDCENPIAEIKKLTGRPVGINLEPIDQLGDTIGDKVEISSGRKATAKAFKAAEALGIDFMLLTGNPSTGVTTASIKDSVKRCRKNFSGLILAGKMHGAGVVEDILNIEDFKSYIELGADGILIPSVGTVPGITEIEVHGIVKEIKKLGGLVMCTIGTSQESADEDTIREFALSNKRVGADIHHIGDGAYGRMPIPENILKLGIVVRGKRHTYFRMAASVRR